MIEKIELICNCNLMNGYMIGFVCIIRIDTFVFIQLLDGCVLCLYFFFKNS